MNSKGCWPEIERVFDLVCDLPPDTQKARLIELTAGNQALFDRVTRLLHCDALPGQEQFLSENPLEALADATEQDLDAIGLGDNAGELVPLGRFGDFELLDEIDRGGMGVVYRAKDLKLNRTIAVKMLRTGKLASDSETQQLKREASSAGGLVHPAVLPVFDIGHHNGFAYFTMPYIEGTDLRKILKNGPMEPRHAADLLSQICSGVQTAHNANLVHSDIKPSNVLIDRDGKPYLSDFGLARPPTGNEKTGTPSGTLGFMAPEQAEGHVILQTDVFGLGALLYASLADRPPFKASSPKETLRQTTICAPVPLRQMNSSVPRDLETVCMKCLEREPSRRYPTANHFALDLKRFLDGEPIEARPDSIVYRNWKRVQKHKLATMFGLVAVVFMIAAAVAITSKITTNRNAEALRQSSLEIQRESLLGEAIGFRTSRDIGQRFESLKRIKSAASLPVPLSDTDMRRFREEAIAAMSLIDLRLDHTWEEDSGTSCVNSSFTQFATSNANGDITIREINSNQQSGFIQGEDRLVIEIEFSPDGKYLGVMYESISEDAPRLLKVCDISSSLTVFEEEIHGHAWEFTGTDNQVIYGNARGGLERSTSGKIAEVLIPGIWVTDIEIHPEQPIMAVAKLLPDEVLIADSRNAFELNRIAMPDRIGKVAWHKNGRSLAAAVGTTISLYEMPSAIQSGSLVGHDSTVSALTFSHGGDLLASVDHMGQVCLWDPTSKTRLLQTIGNQWVQFSKDDRYLAGASIDSRVGIWEVADQKHYRLLNIDRPRTSTPTVRVDQGFWSVSFSNRFGILASSSAGGVYFWNSDLSTEPIGFLPIGHCSSCVFDDVGTKLYTSGKSGLKQWQLSQDGHNDAVSVTPGNQLHDIPDFAGHRLALCNQKDLLAVVEDDRSDARIFDLNSNMDFKIGSESNIDSIAISPNGRWLATGTWRQPPGNISVFDLSTKSYVKTIRIGDARPYFSPDNRLVSGSAGRYRFWSSDDWSETMTISRSNASLPGMMAFTSTGAFVALASSQRDVAIFDTSTGELITNLVTRDNGVVTSISFSPDDTRLAATCHGQSVKVWNLNSVESELQALGVTGIGCSTVPDKPCEIRSVLIDPSIPNYLADNDRTISSLVSAGDFETAIQLVSDEIEKDKANSPLWLDLALLYLQSGAQTKYVEHCERLTTQFRDAKRPRDKILLVVTCVLGLCSDHSKQIAADVAESLVNSYPNNYVYLSLQGAISYRLGDYSNSIESLDSAVKLDEKGGNPADWFFLSMAHYANGSRNESRELIRASLDWLEQNSVGQGWKDRLKLHLLLVEASRVFLDSEVGREPYSKH